MGERWFAVAVALGLGAAACIRSVAPTTMLNIRGLPDEPERRRERLDSADARPGPEGRKALPPKARRVETAAATGAAFLGSLFSKSANAFVGLGGMLGGSDAAGSDSAGSDSGGSDAPTADDPHRPDKAKEAADDPAADPIDATSLTPWVRLHPSPR